MVDREMSWEDYFRRNAISETRAAVKSLEREATAEGNALQVDIGEKHSDVLALIQRIEGLKLLVYRQDSDLSKFASAPGITVPQDAIKDLNQGLGENHICDAVTARLVSIIDRSIVQRNYTLAARGIYLAESLGLPQERFASVAGKLDQRLDVGLLRGTQISQNMLHACMIRRRWSPSAFVAEFLRIRESEINRVLSQNDVLTAFKLVDSTLFLHHQLVSDIFQTRLSQRRVSEMPEFAGQGLLLRLLQDRPHAAGIRAFPSECYDSTKEPSDNSQFLDSIARNVESAAARLFVSAVDVNALTSTLAKFVVQAQSALSAESGMGRLLNACEPPFSTKFEEFVKAGSLIESDTSIDSWRQHVGELRTEQAQVARLSRMAANLAPTFSSKLGALESNTTSLLESYTKTAYTEERKRLLEVSNNTLEETRSTVQAVAALDSAYSSLGGSAEETPKPQYEHLASLVVENWKSQPERSSHGSSVAGMLFDLLLVMDNTLPDVTWTPAILDALRPLILDRVREASPELAAETEKAFYGESGQVNNHNEDANSITRSRLLLRPLVQ